MSRDLMTEAAAIAILSDPRYPRTAETYADRVRAGRRLMPVTTAAERAAAHEFNMAREAAA